MTIKINMANTHDTTNTTNMFYDFFLLATHIVQSKDNEIVPKHFCNQIYNVMLF